MLTTDYAKAIYGAVSEGLDIKKALARLDEVLQRKGHTKLKRGICRALLRHAQRQRAVNVPMVTLERKSAWKELRYEVKSALKELGAEGDPVITEDQSIIGGYRAEFKGRQVDNTHKSKLLALYRNVTT